MKLVLLLPIIYFVISCVYICLCKCPYNNAIMFYTSLYSMLFFEQTSYTWDMTHNNREQSLKVCILSQFDEYSVLEGTLSG
jgi:hypothetical protein